MVDPSTCDGPAARELPAWGHDVPVRLYSITEAARFLRVPEGWLRKKVTAGVVPHTRLGKHVRFTDEHLRRVVSDGEVRPQAPTPSAGLTPSLRARRARPATA